MGLKVSQDNDSDFELVPEGQYNATCVQVTDLGTQPPARPGGKAYHKVLIAWELDDRSETPNLIFQRFTMSLFEGSHLFKSLRSWRGKPFTDAELESFDIASVLGAPCRLDIIHSDDGKWANVDYISRLPKDATKPKPRTDEMLFNLDDPDMEVFAKFGNKLQATIKKSPEWETSQAVAAQDQDAPHDDGVSFSDDDIPF